MPGSCDLKLARSQRGFKKETKMVMTATMTLHTPDAGSRRFGALSRVLFSQYTRKVPLVPFVDEGR